MRKNIMPEKGTILDALKGGRVVPRRRPKSSPEAGAGPALVAEIIDLEVSAIDYFDRIEIIDYQSQSNEAKEFADKVEALCMANRRRLGYKDYFITNGDAILTAYLAGIKAGIKAGKETSHA